MCTQMQVQVRAQTEGPVGECAQVHGPMLIYVDHGHEQTWLQLHAETDAGTAATNAHAFRNAQVFIPAPPVCPQSPQGLQKLQSLLFSPSNPH